MSKNKQTTVEWLEQELFQKYNFVDDEFIFHKAKEIEAEKEWETKAYWFARGILAGRENRISELKPIKPKRNNGWNNVPGHEMSYEV